MGNLTEENREALEELLRRGCDSESSYAAEQVLSFDGEEGYTSEELIDILPGVNARDS